MKNTSHIFRPLLVAATFALAASASTAATDQPASAAAGAPERPASAREQRFPISVAELEARAEAMFSGMDGNSDGVIDPQEFDEKEFGKGHQGRRGEFGPPGPPHMKGERHFPGDQTEDRAARREAREAELFARLDQDADGALSAAEFAGMADARRELRKQHAFARLDANDDGVLDRDEFPPRKLTGLDVNGDGEISREEMRSQFRGEQRPGKQQKAG